MKSFGSAARWHISAGVSFVNCYNILTEAWLAAQFVAIISVLSGTDVNACWGFTASGICSYRRSVVGRRTTAGVVTWPNGGCRVCRLPSCLGCSDCVFSAIITGTVLRLWFSGLICRAYCSLACTSNSLEAWQASIGKSATAAARPANHRLQYRTDEGTLPGSNADLMSIKTPPGAMAAHSRSRS